MLEAIQDINKALALKGQDRKDLRTILRLRYNSKSQSEYTSAEIRAEGKIDYFIQLGIL